MIYDNDTSSATRNSFKFRKISAIFVLVTASGLSALYLAHQLSAEVTTSTLITETEQPGDVAAMERVTVDARTREPDAKPPGDPLQPPSPGARDQPDDPNFRQTTLTPTVLREAATTFRHGKSNIFFDEIAFAHSLTLQNENFVAALRDELRDGASLMALPDDVNFLKDEPSAVLDRMAMIDILGTLAKDDPVALNALVEIVNTSIDPNLPVQVIKALVGEKYDALVELARQDWEKASSTFSALQNEALRETMRPALVGGLVDSGTPREEALSMANSI